MSSENTTPVPGRWYQDDLGRRFGVQSLDAEAGLIQVRYEDGDSGELALAEWRHAMVEHHDSPASLMSEPEDGEP